MYQSIETTAPEPRDKVGNNGGMAVEKRYCNKAFSRGDGAQPEMALFRTLPHLTRGTRLTLGLTIASWYNTVPLFHCPLGFSTFESLYLGT